MELHRDTVRFSKWHEKRVDACVAVYLAFSDFLDFLRLELYLSDRPAINLDPLHSFERAIQTQIIFLDDGPAEKVLRYKGELQQFRNDTILGKRAGSDFTQTQLDFEIPAYLPRLRRDINVALDPTFVSAPGDDQSTILGFLESGKRPPGMNARGVNEQA